MDPNYQPFHKQAVDLQYKFHDVVDDQSAPMAQAMQREVHNLVEDIQSEKHPRDIENRIKAIQQELDKAKELTPPPLDYQEISFLYHSYEHMRERVRQLPNY